MRIALLLVLLLGLGWALCGPGSGRLPLRKGTPVEIQFRRDHLGMAASLPLSPASTSLNGGGTVLRGTLLSSSRQWIELASGKPAERGPGTVFVSRQSVLSVKILSPDDLP